MPQRIALRHPPPEVARTGMEARGTRPVEAMPSTETLRRSGLDYLRVAICLFVVAWHTKVLGPSPAGGTPYQTTGGPTLADIAYFNVFLIAVPCFLVMSAWLLHDRAKGPYMRERLVWLGTVYVFWSLACSLYARVPLTCEPLTVRCVGYKLLTGNGTAANYYFAAQILCDVALFALVSLPRRAAYGLAAAMIGVSTANAVVTQIGPWPAASSWFYSPLNFLIAPALVFVIRVRGWSITDRPARILLGIAAVGLTLVEYGLYAYGSAPLPAYARLSIFATSLLLLSFALPIVQPSSKWLSRLAAATLGVFAVHLLVMPLLGIIAAPAFGLASVAQLVVVLIASFIVAEALRFAFRRRLV